MALDGHAPGSTTAPPAVLGSREHLPVAVPCRSSEDGGSFDSRHDARGSAHVAGQVALWSTPRKIRKAQEAIANSSVLDSSLPSRGPADGTACASAVMEEEEGSDGCHCRDRERHSHEPSPSCLDQRMDSGRVATRI